MSNKNFQLTFGIFALLIATISFLSGVAYYKVQCQKETVKNILSPEAAAQKAIDYLNNRLLAGNLKASLVSVQETSGLYRFTLKIGEKEYTSFVTKDGKILFAEEGIDLDKEVAIATPTPKPKATCEDIKKQETPILEAFVVSQCPFGLQMQRILNEILKNIPELRNNIKVKYIGSIVNGKIDSMHGDEEAQENLRQICIREEQGDKYWSYIDCYIKEGKTNECLKLAKIDEAKLNECVKNQNLGLKYAQADFDLQQKYKVTGSPTLILNGKQVDEFDFGGRTAEAVKTLICCGFSQKPEFCNKKLTEVQAATYFSPTYSKGSSQGGGSCQ